MKKSVFLLAVSCVALSGCTTNLSVHKDPAFASEPAVNDEGIATKIKPGTATRGIPYSLHTTEVKAEITWTLAKCPVLKASVVKVDGKDGEWELKVEREDGRQLRYFPDAEELMATTTGGGEAPSLENIATTKFPVEFAISAKHSTTPKKGSTFNIDYEGLTADLKTGSINVEFYEETGFLKSINADVQGQENKFLSSTIGLAGNVARLAFGLPSGAQLPGGAGPVGFLPQTRDRATVQKDADQINQNPSPCTPAAIAYLEEKGRLLGQSKKIEREIKKLQDELGLLKVAAATGGDSENVKDRIAELLGDAAKEQSNLKLVKASIADRDKRLAMKRSVTLPKKSDQNALYRLESEPSEKTFDAFYGWAIRELDQPAPPPDGPAGPLPPPIQPPAKDEIKAELVVLVELKPDSGDGAQNLSRENASYDGLVFRQPAPGTLRINVKKTSKSVLSKTFNVAQFGRLRVLPLKNSWGESNELGATFSKSGILTSVTYKRPETGIIELVDALDGGVEEILAIQDERRKADEAEEAAKKDPEAERLAELQQQLDIAEAERDLANFGAEPDPPTELQLLETEVQILRLRKEAADLRNEIAQAEALDSESE